MSICSANCNRISFSWTRSLLVFLLVGSCPFRNLDGCVKACPPKRGVFLFGGPQYGKALEVSGLSLYKDLFKVSDCFVSEK